MEHQKNIPAIILKLAILLLFFLHCFCKPVTSQSIINTMSFSCILATNASISYQNNVNDLYSAFTTHASQTGYYFTSTGDQPDVVYGYYMCRGDLSSDQCDSCIVNATKFAQEADCKHKDGIFDSDECIFRYANHSMYGLLEPAAVITTGAPTANVSNYKQYNHTLGILMETLISEAAFGNGSSLDVSGFATREANVTSDETIYGLAQCTPDIVGVNCSRCLRSALSSLRFCCDGTQGAKTTRPNCLLRYDNRTFYNSMDSNNSPSSTSTQERLKYTIFLVMISFVFILLVHV